MRLVSMVLVSMLLAGPLQAFQAEEAMLGEIGRLRGRVHRWHERPVVVTYHPAYLLRNPADKARAWADLCLAAEQLQR